MRRVIIGSCLIGQLIIFCLTANLFESLTMFLLFGVVPWQQTALSPQIMLGFYYVAASAVITLGFRRHFNQLLTSLRFNRSRAQA